MNKVLVFGGSGMLGSMVADVLNRDSQLTVVATVRSNDMVARCRARLPNVEWRLCDLAVMARKQLRMVMADAAWIINAIGMTKPYTHDDNAAEIERAIRINALFPYELAHVAADTGARVLQIATDCVYSGLRGAYTEKDVHDALDVYGKTKSLGESLLPNVHCLRCSIIGPEPKTYAFLLEWFRRQPPRAKVTGYTNHQWNGVTTLQFAKLCHGAIQSGLSLPNIQHVIPTGVISKGDLLKCFSREFKREDIDITLAEAKAVVDRTLATAHESLNRQLWQCAGYTVPPTVPEMVAEVAAYSYRLENLEAS